MFTIAAASDPAATYDLIRGEIQLVASGVWSGLIVPAADAELAAGQRVVLVVGKLDLSGTVVSGAIGTSGAGLFVVGGAAGWRRRVDRRAYRAAAGVRLADLVSDLAAATSETCELAASLTGATVGPAWMRAEGRGGEALSALGQPWRVRADGVTEIGPLVTRASAGAFSLRPGYVPGLGVAVVDFPEDDTDELIPGVVAQLAEDVRITAGDVRLVIGGGTVRAEVASL